MSLFLCDYAEGAHPEIMKRMEQTNFEQTYGYGNDPHCEKARNYIKDICKAPDASVYFLVGGTQTNMTVIAAALRPHQGVISPDTGHINVHESGAIEHTGHKVLACPTPDSKLTGDMVREVGMADITNHTRTHMVQPKMVYISVPTEQGVMYSKADLKDLRAACDEYGYYLYADGARLGYGMMSEGADVTLADMAALTDVFYIGGTKVGALFGEAVVITNPSIAEDFDYIVKQNGGLLAKGRLLGIQFETLFENNLYFEISKHAVDMAMRIKNAFKKAGCSFLIDSPTNQQFPLLTDKEYKAFEGRCELWGEAVDGFKAVRFCTSWATKEEDVAALEEEISRVCVR